MNGYLLTFKHDKMPWSDLENKIERFRNGESVQTWSSGVTRSIPVGAPAYLMRQGRGNPGIFGYGIVKASPQERPHYDAKKREMGKTNLQIAVDFHYLFDPREKIVISKDELVQIDATLWNAQGSGRKIPHEIEIQVNRLFQSRVGADLVYPDELPPSISFTEGATKQVSVNAYERNPEARQ
jgi:5-methylcytosine-specific restriction protein A